MTLKELPSKKAHFTALHTLPLHRQMPCSSFRKRRNQPKMIIHIASIIFKLPKGHLQELAGRLQVIPQPEILFERIRQHPSLKEKICILFLPTFHCISIQTALCRSDFTFNLRFFTQEFAICIRNPLSASTST